MSTLSSSRPHHQQTMLCLADDLTGSADCGAACMLAGLRSLIIVRDDDVADAEFDGLVIDTRSRILDPTAAAAKMERCFRGHYRPRDQVLYQKMDSTLRGNWPAELQSLMRAFRDLTGLDPMAVVAPPSRKPVGRPYRAGSRSRAGRGRFPLPIWPIAMLPHG